MKTMDKTEETEFCIPDQGYTRIMDEYYPDMEKYYEEERRNNTRLLIAIRNVLGQQFGNDIEELASDSKCKVSGTFQLVKRPSGYEQEENFKSFKSIWVDQWAVGDSGDSWSGCIYVKLREGLFLEMPYSC